MPKLKYKGNDLRLVYERDNGEIYNFECHNQFEGGENSCGQAHESLPNGTYLNAWAEDHDTAMNNGPSYGCGYIHTGDPRGRDIHGGGSSLMDPYAAYQGWLCTYGCLRMQNVDVMKLSEMMIEDGNDIELTVVNNEDAEEI